MRFCGPALKSHKMAIKGMNYLINKRTKPQGGHNMKDDFTSKWIGRCSYRKGSLVSPQKTHTATSSRKWYTVTLSHSYTGKKHQNVSPEIIWKNPEYSNSSNSVASLVYNTRSTSYLLVSNDTWFLVYLIKIWKMRLGTW